MVKTNKEYGTVFVGLNVPEEFDKKVKKFLTEYNKKSRVETGRKIYKSEFYILSCNFFMEHHNEKQSGGK